MTTPNNDSQNRFMTFMTELKFCLLGFETKPPPYFKVFIENLRSKIDALANKNDNRQKVLDVIDTYTAYLTQYWFASNVDNHFFSEIKINPEWISLRNKLAEILIILRKEDSFKNSVMIDTLLNNDDEDDISNFKSVFWLCKNLYTKNVDCTLDNPYEIMSITYRVAFLGYTNGKLSTDLSNLLLSEKAMIEFEFLLKLVSLFRECVR